MMENHIINLVINQQYPIKEQLDPAWQITTPLNTQGSYGTLRNACLGEDCNYVAKINSVFNDDIGPNCYTRRDIVRNEMVIAKHMSEVNVAPNIYDMALNDKEGIIIMNKYDGTLSDLLFLYQTDKSIPMEKILQTVEQSLNIIHQNGVIHRDLNTDNILYTKEGLVVISDYGFSFYSDSEQLREYDRKFLDGIKYVYEAINDGEIYPDTKDIMSDAVPEDVVHGFDVLWNGHVCDDWV